MGLKDLNEKLHGRDVHLGRMNQHTSFDPGQGIADENVQAQFENTEQWQGIESPVSHQELLRIQTIRYRRRHLLAFMAGSVATLLVLGYSIFFIRSHLFGEERVEVIITGPKDVASSEETTFTVLYTNNNWAGLKNATLTIAYPETFRPMSSAVGVINGSVLEIPLNDIDARTQAKILVTGKFYGSKGDLAFIRATLRYSPNRVSTVFEKTTQFGVNVASSPLSLDMEAPLDMAVGQNVEYVIRYSNTSDIPFSNLRLKAEYPEGFQFTGAEPHSSEGEAVWYIGNLNAHAEGKIIIRGVLTGISNEVKQMKILLGFFQGDGTFVAYTESQRQTRLVSTPFSLTQTVNGLTNVSVFPGEILRYTIHYKNESALGMRDAILSLEIDPSYLDMSQLILNQGAYDPARKLIIWKASDFPALRNVAPGADGEINFSVPVLNTLQLEAGKNFIIRSTAKIDSPDVPTTLGANKIISSNTLSIKLGSVTRLTARALYTGTPFVNAGPFPPVLGQETSYTLHFNVVNTSNDLQHTKITITLPTGVRFVGKYLPEQETVAFNERTNELLWDIGTLSPNTPLGRELFIQIANTPAPNQVGRSLILMQQAVLTAYDAFTKKEVRIEEGEANTILQYDALYKSLTGNVQTTE
ncbi:MAG: hypothetical protein ACSLEX_00895 [Minisyncoccota bacterium]